MSQMSFDLGDLTSIASLCDELLETGLKGLLTLCDLYDKILLYHFTEFKAITYESVDLKGVSCYKSHSVNQTQANQNTAEVCIHKSLLSQKLVCNGVIFNNVCTITLVVYKVYTSNFKFSSQN